MTCIYDVHYKHHDEGKTRKEREKKKEEVSVRRHFCGKGEGEVRRRTDDKREEARR